MLPPNKYDEWKVFDISFTPQNFLRRAKRAAAQAPPASPAIGAATPPIGVSPPPLSTPSRYRRLIRGFLIYGNIPWLVLGCAIELPHLIPSLSSGPLLVFFICFIPAYWILTGYWLFFRSGAEDLARHPGILRGSPRDPKAIKRELFSFPQGPPFLFSRLW